MDFFNGLKIRGKFSLVAIVTCLLMIVVCIFAFVKMKSVVSLASKIQAQTQMNLSMTGDVKNQWNELMTNSIGMMVASNQTDLGSAREHYTSSLSKIIGTLKEYSKLSSSTSASVISQIHRLVGEYDDEVVNSLLPAVEHNDLQQFVKFRNETIKNYTEKLKGYLFNLNHEQEVMLNEEFVELNARSDITWLFFLIVLMSIISIVLAGLIGSGVAKHIKFINAKCQRIADGDLTMSLDSVKSDDEVGELARSIQKLVVRNHRSVSETVDISESFINSTRKIGKISSTIYHSAKEVVSQSMAVSAASDELVNTTTNIANNCHEATNNSNEAKSVTIQGMEVVKGAVEKIRSQSLKSKEDSAAVLALGQQIDHIDAVVTTIQEIAEQTNLLALNASIEAARAGEHGRGFAVVADEVRALAERTTQSTQEITEMVKAIHAETENATKSMADSVVSMDAVADYAEHLEDSLSEILDKVDRVNVQISQIATASEQQSSTTADISNNMRHITESVQLIANHSNVQNGDALTLSKAAQNLQGSCRLYHL